MSDNATPQTQPGDIWRQDRRGFLKLGGFVVLGAAASGGILAACGSDSKSSSSAAAGTNTTAAAKKTADWKIQLSWVADTEFAPLFLADANGYYKDEGITLEFVPGSADIGSIEGIVAGGSTEIGNATDIQSTVAAVAEGNDLVVIGTMYQKALYTIISTQKAPIRSAKDMVGKKLGGSQGNQARFDAILKVNGLPVDYTYVPTGYDPSPLVKGDVDGYSGFISDEALAYKHLAGEDPVLLSFDDLGLPTYTLPLLTTGKFLKENRDLLKGFLRATIKGFDDNKADPTAGPKLAVDTYGKDAGLTLDNEIEKNAAYLPLTESAGTKAHGYLWIDADYMSGPIYKGMAAAGIKTAPVDKVIDMSLLEEIYAGK